MIARKGVANKRLSVIQCPSVDNDMVFTHEPCTGRACTLWAGACSAANDTARTYKALLDHYPDPGECPLAANCRWHIQAVTQGQTKCLVRRLGELCEHQGGLWSTFDMAPPEEWAV